MVTSRGRTGTLLDKQKASQYSLEMFKMISLYIYFHLALRFPLLIKMCILSLSLSSNLTWKTHIHSLAKHASQKLGFLARTRGFFSSSHLLFYLYTNPSFFRVLLPRLEWYSKNLLSVFSTKSSPKPFVSSIIPTSPNRSNLFPIVV